MNVYHWEAAFETPVRGVFFGAQNVSRTVPEGGDNRLLLMNNLFKSAPLVLPYQTHSALCKIVTGTEAEAVEADAFVTDTPGLAIGVMTADCAPILFNGRRADGSVIVGAAHAGARGALRGIVQSTVDAMASMGATEIKAVIGPCIYPDSYEVGPEFQADFVSGDVKSALFFAPMAEVGKFSFDLPGYVGALLDEAGVRDYSRIEVDTYSSSDCFSYRRATHSGEPDYGRQLSAIMIEAV